MISLMRQIHKFSGSYRKLSGNGNSNTFEFGKGRANLNRFDVCDLKFDRQEIQRSITISFEEEGKGRRNYLFPG